MDLYIWFWNIQDFEGLRWRIFAKGLIFFNIMQNQGVISYIFPHFGLKAQPLMKSRFL